MSITTFSEFIGNHNTLTGVVTMMEQSRIPQTIILEGPVGSGRKTLAMLIAAGILCKNELPCGTCNSCQKVFVTGHPDVSLVLPEKDKAQIRVDQIRKVRSDAYVRPVEGRAKVFIIAGSMNDAAQNAFLKVLEEPPAGVYFILICTHINDLMETVISRGTAFSLGKVSFDQANLLFQREGITISQEEFQQNGSVIGGVLQKEDHLQTAGNIALEMATALANNQKSAFLIAGAKAVENRAVLSTVLQELYQLLHKGVAMPLTGATPSGERDQCACLLQRRFSQTRLLTMANIVIEKQKQMIYNVNGNLFVTALCSELLPRT